VSLSELPQNIVFGLGLGAIYALVAIGFSLVYRTMGLLSFVHPQFVMLGSVFGYTALAKLDIPLVLAIVPVALVSGAAAALIDQVGLRPVRARKGSEIAMILATVGWGIVLVQVVSHSYGTDALSLRSGNPPAPFNVLGVEVRRDTVTILAVGLALVGTLTLLLRSTRAGRALRCVGEDASTASLMGIDVERTYSLAAAVSGMLGGVAGLFVGWLFVGGITAGTIGLKSLAAAVIGGFGSLPGALVGGLALGVIDTLVGTGISSAWRDAVVFGLVIAVLLVRPSGIFGEWRLVRP
jgi:branched-chain amino acid transport system permease protein